MNSDTGRSKSRPSQKRMSRLVRMPTRRPSGSVIGTPENLNRFISSSASCSVRRRRQRHRVGDHPALAALDLLHLGRLVGDREVAVDHADAALAGHRDGHARLGDLVHRRRDEGDRQRDVAGERGRRVDAVGQRLGVPGDDDHVVEGQRLEAVEQLVVRDSLTDLLSAEGGEGGDEQLVLGMVHPGGERLECVVGVDRHGGRGEDGAVVDGLRRDEVDHHPGGGALAGEGLVPGPLDGVGAGQLARQGGVEVDDAVGEPAEEAHREDAHPAGEHDEVGAEPGDDVGEAGVVLGPGLALVAADVHRRDACGRRRGRVRGRRRGRRRRRRPLPAAARRRTRR